MKLIALMPVRNEDWCLWYTLPRLLDWCDEVVVGLHSCTDGSVEMVNEVSRQSSGRVSWYHVSDPEWHECQHRQRLLDTARSRGATHVVIVDADEVLTANLLHLIRPCVEENTKNGHILQLPWVCLARGLDFYYAAGPWFNNWVTTAFRDAPEAHWKARDGYDFHHRHPMGLRPLFTRPVPQREGGLFHLQFVSERRLKAKQALYKLTERLRWPDREPVQMVDKRYNLAVYDSNPAKLATSEVPRSWWPDRDGAQGLITAPDVIPWQETECQKLVYAYPKLRDGLDLFGVA
jgi:hypothetical protein